MNVASHVWNCKIVNVFWTQKWFVQITARPTKLGKKGELGGEEEDEEDETTILLTSRSEGQTKQKLQGLKIKQSKNLRSNKTKTSRWKPKANWGCLG